MPDGIRQRARDLSSGNESWSLFSVLADRAMKGREPGNGRPSNNLCNRAEADLPDFLLIALFASRLRADGDETTRREASNAKLGTLENGRLSDRMAGLHSEGSE